MLLFEPNFEVSIINTFPNSDMPFIYIILSNENLFENVHIHITFHGPSVPRAEQWVVLVSSNLIITFILSWLEMV